MTDDNKRGEPTIFTLVSEAPRDQSLRAQFAARVQSTPGHPPLFRIDVRDFNLFGKLPASAYETADKVLLQGGYVIVDLPPGLAQESHDTLAQRLMGVAFAQDIDKPVKGRIFINPPEPLLRR